MFKTEYSLPKIWTKDFTITASYDNVMGSASYSIRFTYDSMVYERLSQQGKRNVTLPLSASERDAVLAKMHELKADKIKSEAGTHPVHDGWSTAICFNFHCIEGGSSANMNEQDKAKFLTTVNFLETFASTKAGF